MARAALFRCLPVLLFLLSHGRIALASDQSISTSRQFIVYGTDLAVRGAICDFAERTKRDLLSLLGQSDAWTTAIVINARYPEANLPELPKLQIDLGQTGFGLKLQLELTIDRDLARPEIRRALLRALVLEMMYRRQPNLSPGAVYVSPPDWLLDGVPSAQSDMPRDKVGALLAISAAAGNVWPLEKFLGQKAELLDAVARNLYRAYSFALVDMLSRAPDGPRRIRQFILDLPQSSNDRLSELRAHFPELFGAESAELTWQKQIVRLAANQPYQLLSSAETERRLEETLRVKISDHGQQRSYELTQFGAFLNRKSARNALAMLGDDLGRLATRANPLYAPIIEQYTEILALLRRGKTLAVPRRLEELAASRKAIAAQMREIDDYLNWFEATSLAGPSGQFVDYFRAAESAAEPARGKRDPITVYLDALETQFQEESVSIR